MKKYVDADALKAKAFNVTTINKREIRVIGFNDVDRAPAADVAEVVHGEWLKHGLGTHQWFCSVCEGKESAKRPYCPRCGARLDGKEDV